MARSLGVDRADARRTRLRGQGRSDRRRAGQGHRGAIAVGVGDGALTPAALRDAAAAFARAASNHGVLATNLHDVGAAGVAASAQAVVEGVLLARYRYGTLKRDRATPPCESRSCDRTVGADRRRRAPAPTRGTTTAAPRQLARDLANSPPSHLTATPPRRAGDRRGERGRARDRGVRRRATARARVRRPARRQRRQHRAAAHGQADVPARARRRRPAQLALVGKGDHVRLRRHQPEAERPDARLDEDGHVRRRGGAVGDVGAARARVPQRGHRLPDVHRQHAVGVGDEARRRAARSAAARPSRSTTPTPRVGSCSPTGWCSPPRSSPTRSSTSPRSPGRAWCALGLGCAGVLGNDQALVDQVAVGRRRRPTRRCGSCRSTRALPQAARLRRRRHQERRRPVRRVRSPPPSSSTSSSATCRGRTSTSPAR